jgi:hypothetical protein
MEIKRIVTSKVIYFLYFFSKIKLIYVNVPPNVQRSHVGILGLHTKINLYKNGRKEECQTDKMEGIFKLQIKVKY